MRKEDDFEISYGNLMVLKTVPDMMIESHWRKKLRGLVLEYLTNKATNVSDEWGNINFGKVKKIKDKRIIQ